jgi:energy-coupling factor transporter ATP-binding protein EcfA2
MRIKTIQLSWFRGAAEVATLDTTGKSLVVFGTNGSGKSSFVDAVEHVINKGKIGHLAHEYSGRHQEKGIINTHKRPEDSSKLEFVLDNTNKLEVLIQPNGEFSCNGPAKDLIESWDYRRTILRQSEVADFINGTKGDKYSDILPLLGLRPLELTAENFRQIARAIDYGEDKRKLESKLEEIKSRRINKFGIIKDEQLFELLSQIYTKYGSKDEETGPDAIIEKLEKIFEKKIKDLNTDQQKYLATKELSEVDIRKMISAVRDAAGTLAQNTESLIAEKISVLQTASQFGNKLEKDIVINCPACGHEIGAGDFREHVATEQSRLQKTMRDYEKYKTAIVLLCNGISSVQSSIRKLKALKSQGTEADVTKTEWVLQYKTEDLRSSCDENKLVLLEENLLFLTEGIAKTANTAPDDIQKLIEDQKAVAVIKEVSVSKGLMQQLNNILEVSKLAHEFENSARKEIRDRSSQIINEISKDIQRMWEVLHPDKKIENIRLNLPEGSDKAIDVCLKFYGKDQISPRITLSEGNRNSLGLCIFLAMAKRDQDVHPLFLDDVIISLDRGYRGMVAELLVREFSDRQVLIFTHDREWFADLKQQLDDSEWLFKWLSPWIDPATGIRWSEKTTGFDVAYQQLDAKDPDGAANKARKIMDLELPLIGEKLCLRLPYKHRERNDRRMAHEFLDRFITESQTCFQVQKPDGSYETHTEGIQKLKDADGLILSWGGRGSHDFDVESNEARSLIEACENALSVFICSECSKSVGKNNDESSHIKQCQCGHLRWRYGKAGN